MSHFDNVVGAIREGEVIPFLGAGVNLFGREEQTDYQPGTYLPSGRELSQYLVGKYPGYPTADRSDLSRVSQYVSLMLGSRSLYKTLGAVFDSDYPITRLHTLFAKLPKILRAQGHKHPYQVIVTTNYDDVLERAFYAEDEPYDLVTYVATKPDVGKFRHIPHNGHVKDSVTIPQPNEYLELPFEDLFPERTVILKIHGMVERAGNRTASPNALHDSFVITEDDYIDYLAHSDLSTLIPVQLTRKLTNSSFLFLGYGLRDWNLRVIMHRLWHDQRLDSASWAVQREVDELDKKFWGRHKVELVQSTLETYIDELEKALL